MSEILALDQGTTSSRAIRFAVTGTGGLSPVATVQREFAQIYPRPGEVEHDPEEIWATTLSCARAAMSEAVVAIGITNQRETTVIWDRASGAPIANALVWQDRRTAPACTALRDAGAEAEVTAKTGLLLDPYFSATKIGWLLDAVPGARARAEAGALAFGTVDAFLIWRLTGGRVHATDATNAARTMLYDIERGEWDADLCRMFGVPMALLPEVRDCAAEFGATDPALFGRALPIRGVAGDQQAAAMGQACFAPGMMKSTYGTGCFALLTTGAARIASGHRLLTTVASRFAGRTHFALEGSIFVAGAVVQWLRDGLKLIDSAAETQALAETADPAQQVLMVPAFTGLGAPWWRPEAQGAIFGLSRGTGRAEIARAALQSVGYQTRDLWEAMRADAGALDLGVLRVDGGMARSDWTMQFLADILGAPVDRPAVTETTALGAAWLAGWQAGLCPGPEEAGRHWALERRFEPAMAEAPRAAAYARWRRAVAATISV